MRYGLLIAALLAASHAAAAPASLEVTAAWSAVARPLRLTEVRVAVSSTVPGTVRLRIRSGPATIQSSIAVSGRTPVQVGIPVPASESVRVDAELPDATHLTRNLALRLSESPLVAVAGGPATPDLPSSVAQVEVGQDDFPEDTEAFGAINALVVTDVALSNLNPRQLRALIGYLGRCGAMIATALPPSVANVLTSGAGCNGSSLVLVPDPEHIAGAIAAALAAAPDVNVRPAALRDLLQSAQPALTLVPAAFFIYVLGAVVVAALVRHPAALPAYALLATIGAVLTGHLIATTPRLTIWAETNTGAVRARYTALAEILGSGRGARSVVLPTQLTGSEPCIDSEAPAAGDSATEEPPGSLDWFWDAQQQRYTQVTYNQTLLSAGLVCWQGSFQLDRSAVVARRANGSTSVTNTGQAAWPAGVAIVGGQVLALPAAAKGSERGLTGGMVSSFGLPVTQLAVSRSRGGDALLWQLPLPGIGAPPFDARGFVLLHLNDAEGGG